MQKRPPGQPVSKLASPHCLPVCFTEPACCNTFPPSVSNFVRGLKNPMRALRLLLFAGRVALLVAVFSRAATAQSGDFEIALNGHAVGTANFHFTSSPQGFDSSSLVKVTTQGLDYALSKTERLSPSNELQHALVSATVNGEAVNLVAAPDSAQFLVNISASGKSTTTRLAAHSGAVLLADFDPGGLETLLTLAVMRNNRDLWAIVPRQSGSIEPVHLATYPDQEGTLDGTPIAVHHLVATVAGTETNLFSGPENQLLQAELPQPGFALIRKGFVLKPSAKPVAPSVGAPEAQPGAPT